MAKTGACLARMAGLNWDARKWWNENKAAKWVFYHPLDRDISESNSLGKYEEHQASRQNRPSLAIKLTEEKSANKAHMYPFSPYGEDGKADAQFMSQLYKV